MFCPKCSRAVEGDVQFCQQCGLALEGVRKILEGGSGLESGSDKPVKRGLSPRRKGLRQGFKLVLLALLILPFYPVVEGFLESLIPSVENTRLDELPLELFGTALFVIFAAGLGRMLYARLFESLDASEEEQKETPPKLFSVFGRRVLPPSRSIPVEDYVAPRRADTADLARPRSVTEHTTRSLRID